MCTKRKVLFAFVAMATAVLRAFVVAEIGLRVRYGKIERITGAGDWKRKTPASMHSNLVGYL